MLFAPLLSWLMTLTNLMVQSGPSNVSSKIFLKLHRNTWQRYPQRLVENFTLSAHSLPDVFPILHSFVTFASPVIVDRLGQWCTHARTHARTHAHTHTAES